MIDVIPKLGIVDVKHIINITEGETKRFGKMTLLLFRRVCYNSASYEYKSRSASKWVKSVPIWIHMTC